MRKIVTWMAAGAVLLVGAAATPLAAQCMACVSSSGCGPSSSRGSCSAECMGTICACSDNVCRPPVVTVAPVGAEYPARFAVQDGEAQPSRDAVALLVSECNGKVEFLVYSADGTRLIEARLLSPAAEASPPTRLAGLEISRD